MKNNNKGFTLIETLVVSVFVMSIFTVIYTNFFPLMGEYEKRERYDDIDSLYNTYIVKKYIEKNCDILPQNTSEITNLNINLINGLNIKKIYYIKGYNLSMNDIAKMKNDTDTFDYVNSLPNFRNNPQSLSGRIIVKYENFINVEDEHGKNSVYSFSTIGIEC